MRQEYQKKVKLGVANRRTRWAPFWVVIKKYGMGKAKGIHPSRVTKQRRHWRTIKLKIKPRKTRKNQLG